MREQPALLAATSAAGICGPSPWRTAIGVSQQQVTQSLCALTSNSKLEVQKESDCSFRLGVYHSINQLSAEGNATRCYMTTEELCLVTLVQFPF
jgi:hypothetical protein